LKRLYQLIFSIINPRINPWVNDKKGKDTEPF